MDIIKSIKNSVIVSVQSTKGDPTNNETCMKAFMKSAVIGGAKGLRLADFKDIKNAKKMFGEIVIIGITKPNVIPQNFKELVYITPSVRDVKKLIKAGADIIAFDATKRHDYTPLIKEIKKSGKISMGDISTYEEAKTAQELGCDIISTTLSGYTTHSKQSDKPDFELLEKLTKELDLPVIMEGKIWEKEEVKTAFNLGAHAVVIGSAITRPWLITERFINA